MAFDLNRGMEMRRHSQTGMEVGMYFDNPGHFYTAHGSELPAEIAAECGFNVVALLGERRKREMGAKALAEIAKLFVNDQKKFDVVEEKGPFKLVDTGQDQWDVYDGENKLNPTPLVNAVAKGLFDRLAAMEPKEEAADKAA